jgi:hypothetical protein
MNNLMEKRGYTILILILVLMAISLSIIISTSFLGIDEAKLSPDRFNSDLGLYLSTSCAEEALEIIRSNNKPDNYQQLNETRLAINFPGNVSQYCWYLVTGTGTQPKYIRARSEVNGFPRRIEIKLIKNKPITFGYWREQ